MDVREFAAWERQATLVSLRTQAHDAAMAGDRRTVALTQFQIRKMEVGAEIANMEQAQSVGRN